jgi:3-hydroxybutyryl-CoA dehydrogenase
MAARSAKSVQLYDRSPVNVLVLGAGLMGAQIGSEYALGGHSVALVARDADSARSRFEQGLETLRLHRLASAEEVDAARARVQVTSRLDDVLTCEVAVESLPEDLELKARLLRPVVEASPEAVLATNTSSLSVSELGERIRAPERTVGTHYWNPPLLMPLVEVVAGSRTDPEVVRRTAETLRELGKRPVLVGDVPGFAWNRLQMAVLREAVALVEHGVASPAIVDEILTHGLARRWRHIGFFQAIALGGVETWQKTAANLLPLISAATELPELSRWVQKGDEELAAVAARRDEGLARDLLAERSDRDQV